MKVLRASWMREIDRQAIDGRGIPSIVLMEQAAKASAGFFAGEFPRPRFHNVIALIGKGNNGGDGLAVGRLLHQQGYRVHFLLLAPASQLSADPLANFNQARDLGLECREIGDAAEAESFLSGFSSADTFIIDAIFGTGLSKPLSKGLVGDVIQAVNRSGLKIAAIDIPSGLAEDFLPDEGIHVRADVTAAVHALKLAHIHPDGNRHCGKIRVLDIGIPAELAEKPAYYLNLIFPELFRDLLQDRPVDAHKGDFGHLLAIVGSMEKPGAGILGCFAALRSGSGLVTAAVPPENRLLYVAAHPELMVLPWQKINEIIDRLDEFDSVLAGPGLGNHPTTRELVGRLLEKASVPLILDADALNVLENSGSLLKRKNRPPLVLTPHLKEFSRLSGLPAAEILRDRVGLGREFARQHGVVLVLKGHHTIIATPEGTVWLNQTGNPGMASAGSGDVLSGMIAGMVGQFIRCQPLEKIVAAAVFLHGYAADLAVRKTGQLSLVASDIVDHIPASITQIDGYRSPFLEP